VQRAQATVEYVALVAVALIAACLLVRYATPAQRLARDIAHVVSGAPRRRSPHITRRASRHPRHVVKKPCLCPFQAQLPQPADD
jgi:hypothetical protein